MSETPLFTATSFPEIYERFLVKPLFRPFAEQLLAHATPHRGDTLIDVACGTGIVARVARERLGEEARIVGVDVAPPMVAVARTVDPTIDWREGNAMSLPSQFWRCRRSEDVADRRRVPRYDRGDGDT
jgi:trans-aconitate methyltransferase